MVVIFATEISSPMILRFLQFRQELEDALRASEEEFLRQADIEEQAALAAAMEASQACQAHPSPPNSGLGAWLGGMWVRFL